MSRFSLLRGRGTRRPATRPAPGERVLAWAASAHGEVAGSRDALYVPHPDGADAAGPVRVPWHEVETADWDADAGELVVREVGTWGRERPVHRLALEEPGRLLELVRERVTATVVLTRPVPLAGGRRATVVGRRATSGDREVAWFVDYPAGVDPADPAVAAAVDTVLARARVDVGEG